MDNKLKLIRDTFGADRFKNDVLMSEMTALKMGGVAKLFFVAFTQNEITKIVAFCKQLKVPFIIFGTGSKMVISDDGFKGLVIKNSTGSIEVVSIKGKVLKNGVGVDEAMVEVESGVNISDFVIFLKRHGLLFDEFVDLVGTIGGNIFLSQSIKSKMEGIKVLNLKGRVEMIKSYELSLVEHVILSTILKIKAIDL